MTKNIDISKIKVKFGGKYQTKDKKLIKLLEKAYQGELLVRVALIKFAAIKPFSDFQPEITPEFLIYFENKEKEGKPPPIYVYPSNEHFIMSDDYTTYYIYKKKKYSEIMCILLGDSNSEFILEKSEPFKLPLPEVQVIND